MKLGTILAASMIIGSANAAPLYTLTADEGYSNGSWSFGEIFTVGGSDLTVTALGAYDSGADGFVTAGGIDVGLYLESDGSLLASTTVTSTDSLDGFFRYATISDIVLSAGEQYRVVASSGDDLYNIASYTAIFSDAVTYNGYGYCAGGLQFCNDNIGTERTWMANLQFTTGTSAVPVPAAVWLFGSGLLGLVGVARRKTA